MNCELPDVQAGFRKGRGARDQIANICWIIKKAREFQKNFYFCFIDYAKAFDCVTRILIPLPKAGLSARIVLSFSQNARKHCNKAKIRPITRTDFYLFSDSERLPETQTNHKSALFRERITAALGGSLSDS